MPASYHSDLVTELPLIYQGKVRDCFAVGEDHMMVVASDRLSAFDVVLPDPIPDKGALLTRISNFWFERTQHIVANHMSDIKVKDVISDPHLAALLEPRAVVVKKLKPLPLEAIVRGYIIGSGWKEYQRDGSVCGISLPAGLQQADRLPEVIFTPSTKAALGEHDENVDFETIVGLVGEEMANRVRDISIRIFSEAGDYARERGIIIADTKFEFGLDENGELRLMDEVLTPDSSRFWPAGSYQPGSSPPSYDKQYIRDYLETLDWDKTAPGPHVPEEVIQVTADKYAEVCRLLAG
ncbi:MAG: phosphoribosylaminoimidazolesuccinocarboxamide synthase [Xanthomonadales bacterium]|nr:phosphoribosylaminoimidazolesuccinocarboxamide synthase [Gammaproteobacteria bacterium]NNL95401.1 phosphoribosylaminoimidazolesuccinocarboxamide synthase [Xanthomonadales bacterium]